MNFSDMPTAPDREGMSSSCLFKHVPLSSLMREGNSHDYPQEPRKGCALSLPHEGDGKRTGADMGGDHAAELTPMDKGDAGDP